MLLYTRTKLYPSMNSVTTHVMLITYIFIMQAPSMELMAEMRYYVIPPTHIFPNEYILIPKEGTAKASDIVKQVTTLPFQKSNTKIMEPNMKFKDFTDTVRA